MCVQRKLRGGYARWVLCLCAVVVQGCGVWLTPESGDDDSLRTTLSSSVVDLDDEATYYEANPNHLFELAAAFRDRIRDRLAGLGAPYGFGAAEVFARISNL